MFMYGSILIDVTLKLQAFISTPILDAVTPFPIPLMTPPLTRMYFMADLSFCGFDALDVTDSLFPICHMADWEDNPFLFEVKGVDGIVAPAPSSGK